MQSGSRSHKTFNLPKVAIIGGGVIGLSVGWRLAQAGCRVDVFERHRTGQGASWAAAGMLAAGAEAMPGEAANFELGRRSQALWSEFATQLERAAGQSIEYRTEGTVVTSLKKADQDKVRQQFEFLETRGARVSWLTGEEVRGREPVLSRAVCGGYFSSDDGQVNNRKLVMALRQAVGEAGGIVHEGQRVLGVEVTNGSATGVIADSGLAPAEIVVVACGLGSKELKIKDLMEIPMIPVKGQMMALSMGEAYLSHVVRTGDVYLVPRRSGRLVVGATSERGRDDDLATEEGLAALKNGVAALAPDLASLPLEETWAGVRPGTRDGLPILGSCTIPDLILATGHYRNGILWTPITAALVTELIVSGRSSDLLKSFSLNRFSGEWTKLKTALNQPSLTA